MNRSQRMVFWSFLSIAGLAVWIIFMFNNIHRAWISVLSGFIFFTPLTAGLITWSAIVNSSFGKWPGKLERIPLTAIGCIVSVFLLFFALWISVSSWKPSSDLYRTHPVWFNTTFLFTRNFIVLFLFWLLALMYHHRRNHGPARKYAAWLIILYCITITILAFDFIMGYSPWSSTVFGAYVFITGLYAAVVIWTLIAIVTTISQKRQLKESTYAISSIDKIHDLGKLVFAFSILSSYLLFCHVLPIWYENLPTEIEFLIHRTFVRPWNYVSIGLLATIFLGPILFLMPLNVKRTPWLLGLFCAVIFIGLWVERLWLIFPAFDIHSLAVTDFGILIAFFGISAIGMEIADRLIPVSKLKENNNE